MKLIKLNNDKFAQVDDEDYSNLIKLKWNQYTGKNKSTPYVLSSIKVNDKWTSIQMQRIVLGLKVGDKKKVDHKDGNGLNNQKDNLRIATSSQNGANRRPSRNGTSKYLGVHWDKTNKKWRACLTISGITIKLGRFDTEEETALAYNQAAIKHHGEFARLNTI